MKKLLDYIRYSSIVLMIQFNPVAWFRFEIKWDGPSDMNPGLYELYISILMFRLNIALDDGSW
jgi:hypothetical protein